MTSRKELRLKPRLIINTGHGKGKTTAAAGTVLRAWNQGWSIAAFQFVKSAKWRTGEAAAIRELGRVHDETGIGGPVEWHALGQGWSWSRAGGTGDDAQRAAQGGWDELKARLAVEAHDLYFLDEFTYPITWGWLDLDDVVTTLRDRPGCQHVLITGRNAPEPLIDIADLVTEMVKIKHPYDEGEPGQAGIEW